MLISKILERIQRCYAKRNSESYRRYLIRKGLKIGDGTVFTVPKTIDIDTSRPSLIEIGKNVRLGAHMTIMCHDAAAKIFRAAMGTYLNSSGKIKIGDNVYFGRYCTVLKGVTIGDNCIIGFGSTVMKDIPSNSVAVGTPAKVISTIEEYYKKRVPKALNEAFEYLKSIQSNLGRRPRVEDCKEEFIYFVSGKDVDKYPNLPIKYQLGPAYENYCKNYIAPYASFDDFLKAAGIK